MPCKLQLKWEIPTTFLTWKMAIFYSQTCLESSSTFRAVWQLPVAVVTVSDWLVSGLSLVKSSAESFTEPHTCKSFTKSIKRRGWQPVSNMCLVPERGITNYKSHVLTGKGSAPSWMTKPSMRCVRTFGLTTAWGGGALSPWPQTPRDTDSTGEGQEGAGGGAPDPDGGERSSKKALC